MRYGICITYRYSGDEAKWTETVGAFIRAVAADTEIAGRFSYHVQKLGDGAASCTSAAGTRPRR